MELSDMPMDNQMVVTNEDIGFVIAMIISASIFILVAIVIFYVIYALLLSRIFKKARIEEWAAWVPVYNNWKLLELGGQKGFWAVLAIVPIVNIASMVFMYIAMYHVGKKLGKENWFVLLAIFFPLIWFIWLAFDDSKWPQPKKLKYKTKVSKNQKK